MNTTRLSSLFAFGLLVSGCAPIGFDLSRPIDEQTLQGDPVANAAGQVLPAGSFQPISFSVDLAAEGRTRNVPIGRVLLKSLQFNITNTNEPAGDTDDFSFVRSAHVFLECTGSGCTLPRVEIAAASAPGAVRSLVFSITPNVNLKPYIDAGVRIVVEADGIPPADNTSFNGAVTVRVEPF